MATRRMIDLCASPCSLTFYRAENIEDHSPEPDPQDFEKYHQGFRTTGARGSKERQETVGKDGSDIPTPSHDHGVHHWEFICNGAMTAVLRMPRSESVSHRTELVVESGMVVGLVTIEMSGDRELRHWATLKYPNRAGRTTATIFARAAVTGENLGQTGDFTGGIGSAFNFPKSRKIRFAVRIGAARYTSETISL